MHIISSLTLFYTQVTNPFQPIKIKNSSVTFKKLPESEANIAILELNETVCQFDDLSKRIIQVTNIPKEVNGIEVKKEHLNLIFLEGFGSGQGYKISIALLVEIQNRLQIFCRLTLK